MESVTLNHGTRIKPIPLYVYGLLLIAFSAFGGATLITYFLNIEGHESLSKSSYFYIGCVNMMIVTLIGLLLAHKAPFCHIYRK